VFGNVISLTKDVCLTGAFGIEGETSMATNQPRESAQIFQFPAGGRGGMKTRVPSSASVPDLADIAAGGCWYHEEAIRDDQPRKN
jgi:hypothetical protein